MDRTCALFCPFFDGCLLTRTKHPGKERWGKEGLESADLALMPVSFHKWLLSLVPFAVAAWGKGRGGESLRTSSHSVDPQPTSIPNPTPPPVRQKPQIIKGRHDLDWKPHSDRGWPAAKKGNHYPLSLSCALVNRFMLLPY